MTTRLKNLMQTVCIVLILMLFPSTARLQEQKEPAPPQAAAPQGEAPVPPAEPSAAMPAPPAAAPAIALPPPSQEAAAAPAPAAEEQPPYIIKKGDTLWDISNTFLKDPFLWPFLWKANPAITNPDLIFPGNKLVIPSIAPIERALQAAPDEKQEFAKEAAAVKETTKPEEIATAHVAAPTPIQPAPAAAEEVPAAKSRIIMPEAQIFPIVDKYAMISAGFVNEEATGDTITGAQEPGKALMGFDDIVYVSIHDADSVKIGDKYLIFASLHKVKHPITHEPFGNLIKGLGLLQIIDKDQKAKVLTARITLSFDEVEAGNMVTPYQEPVPIYQSSIKKAKDISGYILEVTDRRSISAQTDVVYLDRGNADGVEPGDSFLVYANPDKKGNPRRIIAEVQVLLVKEHTSTAVVKKSTETMGRGYAVDFKK